MIRLLPLLALAALVAAPSIAAASPPDNPSFYQVKPGWEVEGTVKKVKKDEITLSRQGMPDAELEVSKDHTVVMIDGKRGSVTDLKQGAPVRASFQIDGDDLVAVRIETASGGQGSGAGSQGSGKRAR